MEATFASLPVGALFRYPTSDLVARKTRPTRAVIEHPNGITGNPFTVPPEDLVVPVERLT